MDVPSGGFWNVAGKISYMKTDGSVMLDFPTPPSANCRSHTSTISLSMRTVRCGT
jgi:hypothetical protein